MLYIAVALIFITIMMISYFVLLAFNSKKIEMADRITSVENMDKAWIDADDTPTDSVASLLFKSLGSFLIKLTPGYNSKKNKMMLEKAGVLRETTTEKWVAKRAVIILMSSLFTGFIVIVLTEDINRSILFALFAGLFVWVLYKYSISKRITRRTNRIIKDLPYTLDLITVSVEAGLSLDGAIGRIVGSIKGPLSDEFGQTLKEMRMGIAKKEALNNMANRIDNKDLSMILSSIIQADEMGVTLGKILRIEGADLREKRKQAAREKAMKAPVKMLFPLILFIFPTVFIVILGPTIIQLMDGF